MEKSNKRKVAVRGGIAAMALSAAALVGLTFYEGYSIRPLSRLKVTR